MSSTGYATTDESSADRNVEMWKIKKLIKSLELARGYDDKVLSTVITEYEKRL